MKDFKCAVHIKLSTHVTHTYTCIKLKSNSMQREIFAGYIRALTTCKIF